MSVQMQWNLPEDCGPASVTAEPFDAGVHGVRMSNAAGPWCGESLVVYGNVTDLRAWHESVGVVIASLPEPEPRFEYGDLPVHGVASYVQEMEAAGQAQHDRERDEL